MIDIETLTEQAHRITIMAEFRQADAERLLGFAKQRNAAGGGGHVLIDLTAASAISFSAVTLELAHLPSLLKWVYGLDRIAIVSDDDWVRTAARLESALLPGVTYEVFAEDEADAARAWVKGKSDSPHGGAFREIDLGRSDLIGYELAGRLDREQSLRGIAMIRQRLADSDCRRLMMVISAWHGFDIDQVASRELIAGKLELANMLERYAIVGGPSWLGRIAEAMSVFAKPDIRAFAIEDREAAMAWLAA